MFGLLPDLTPRDSHSTWYTSSRNPIAQAALLDAQEQRHAQEQAQHGNTNNQNHPNNSRRALIERSALARLRTDEQHMERRRLHVQNFGSTWLRPPGVPKTLHQMREERKEQEEHAEAMRREALAQELADAEAAGQDDEVLDEGAEEEEEVRDLDDEIPDAEESFGFDGGDDEEDISGMTTSDDGNSSDEDENGDGDDDDDDDDRTEGPGGQSPPPPPSPPDAERRDDLVAARMRMADDAFRQAMARGDADGGDIYGGEEDLEAEGAGHMLDEDDLLAAAGDDPGMGDYPEVDLDDEIPEAGELSGMYEHTDSEVGLSSSIQAESSSEDEDDDDDEGDISFAPRAAPLIAPRSPTMGRGAGPRSSIDLSGLLSADGSSIMDSSMLHSSPVRPPRR